MTEQQHTYKRRAGVDAWQGHKFEWGLTLLAYLRCQRLHEEWKKDGTSGIKSFSVANNVDGAGNFDDVVVRVEYVDNGEIKNKTIFVQCKHISSVTDAKKRKNAFSTKLFSDKAIDEYANSFANNQSSKIEQGNTLTVSTNEPQPKENLLKNFLNFDNLDTEVLLYSNIGVDEDYKLEKYQLNSHKIESDITTMIFNTSSEKMFEFRLHKTSSAEENSADQLFCEKFRIFLSQTDELEPIVEKEIELLSNESLDIQSLRESLFHDIQLHFTSSSNCLSLTEKCDILSNIINFIALRNKGKSVIDNFCKTIFVKNIFSEQAIHKIQHLLYSKSKEVFKIESRFQKFETLKFLQLLRTSEVEFTSFFIDDELDIVKWVSARKTRTYGKIERVYVLFSNIEISSKFESKMNETLIQIIESGNQISLSEYAKEFSLEAEKYILNQKVHFQGEYLDIKDFCGDSWKKIFDERKICNILENKLIVLGPPLPTLDFYVPRTFIRVILSLGDYREKIKTWNIKGDCIILFSEKYERIPGNDAAYMVFKDMEEVRTFVQKFVRSDEVAYHLCSYQSGQMQLLFSFGKSSSYTRENIIGEDDLMNETKAKISILSDVAGMGKTTTLLALARKYKQNNPSHWVFFIEVNKYLQLLKNNKQFKTIDFAVQFVGSKLLNLNETELLIFTNACNMSGNVTLFFDAFDEISPEAEKSFPLLLSALEKTKIKNIVVSSRPNYAHFLEESLLHTRVKFQGLTTEEKEKALDGYWKQMLTEDNTTIDDNKLKGIVKNTVKLLEIEEEVLSEILAIPLQIRMLANVYYESLVKVNTKESIPDSFAINLANLYEKFIQLHAERFYVDKHEIPRYKIRHRQIQEKLKGAEEIACQNIIPEVLKNNEIDRSIEIAALCDDVGIITNKSPVVFLHRTVAEYLAAKYIVREIFTISSHGVKLQHFNHLLMDDKFNIVRKFINSLLIGERADILVHYQSKDIKNIVKEFRRTPLHVSASEGNVEIIKCLLASNNAFLNMTNSDGETALKKAIVNRKTEAVQFLLSHRDCSIHFIDKYDDTALHAASERGYVEIMKLILQRDPSLLNMQNNKGHTPLHRACCCGKTEAVKFLLSHDDCSVSICAKDGYTVLHAVSWRGDVEIMQLILQRDPTLLNMQDNDGYTPLHGACNNNTTEAMKFLLSHSNCSVNIRDKDGDTVLHAASKRGYVEIIKLILQRDPSLLNMQNNEASTPLHTACAYGTTEAMKFLLSHSDCSVNICAKNGDTVLHAASKRGYVEIMQLILQRDPSLLNMQNNEGSTPLHTACAYGTTEAMKFLLSHSDCSVNICAKNGDTVLHTASMRGYVEIMQLILQRDPSLLNMQNNNGSTPLHTACELGETEAGKFLLSHSDCSVNICAKDGDTVLHAASKRGYVEIIKLILQRDPSLLNMQNNEGSTPLHTACAYGTTEAKKFLLSHSDCSVNICAKNGDTVLHTASKRGYVEIMQLILQRDPSLLNMQNNNGSTPLHRACELGETEAGKFLLSHSDCSVNICAKDGDTVLHAASKRGYVEIMQLILQRDPSLLNMQNNRGYTPLHRACLFGTTEAVKFLLSHSDCLVSICNIIGDTVLHAASVRSDVEIMQLILKRDPSLLNMQNNEGYTPLHTAYAYGKAEAVKFLLSHSDCSVNIYNKDGATVLHNASERRDVEIMQLILQRDPSLLNMQNNEGYTPLHRACLFGRTEAVKFLLTQPGCSVNIRDNEQRTALELAREKRRRDIIELLSQHGAESGAMETEKSPGCSLRQ